MSGQADPIDTDLVCLHETYEEARSFRDEFRPGGWIIAVAVDGDEAREPLALTRNGEGYWAVYGRIPNAYLTVVDRRKGGQL